MVDLTLPTKNAMDDAIDYAWQKLKYVPHDGGDVHVQFEQIDRDILWYDHDAGEARRLHYKKEWTGTAHIRHEEGTKQVNVRVERQHEFVPQEGQDHPSVLLNDVYSVDVSWGSTDCDGRYSGGHTVTFVEDEIPAIDKQSTRDYSAEAAGY